MIWCGNTGSSEGKKGDTNLNVYVYALHTTHLEIYAMINTNAALNMVFSVTYYSLYICMYIK